MFSATAPPSISSLNMSDHVCLLTAKRAYLHTLAFPPAIFTSSTSSITAVVKPYDGPDAQAIISTVNARQHSSNGRGHGVRNSVSHGRGGASVSNPHRNSSAAANANTNGSAEQSSNGSPRDREPSPTLPNLPSHPTLNALISSSLSGDVSPVDPTSLDPAVIAAQPDHGGPRIGDPGKRMLGAALGVRHPGLGPRAVGNGPSNGVSDLQRAMSGLIVAE